MKKLFTLLAFVFCLFTSVWAVSVNDINSYATRLRLVGNGAIADDGTVGIRFYVMAPTKGVWVYVDLDKDGNFEATEAVFSDANRTIAKNNYDTIYLKIPDSTPVGEYRWAVKVKGSEDHSGWSAPKVARNYENSDYRYCFSKAMGVAVDCSYESSYFGYSYVTETHYNRNAWGNANSTKTDGIYRFTPQMGTSQFNRDANDNLVTYGAFTGSLTTKIKNNQLNESSNIWGRDDESSNTVTAEDGTKIPRYNLEHSPSRLCTDKDGYVYVCENVPAADRAGKVFRMNPAAPTDEFDIVLTTSHIEAAASASGVNFSKRLQSATVVEENGNKILYAILASESKSQLSSVYLCAFNITDLNNVTYAGKYKSLTQFSCTNVSTKQDLTNIYNQIIPGHNGDFWIFQNRSSATTKYSGTIHLDRDLNCDYIIPTASGVLDGAPVAFNTRGAGAINHDGSILAIPTNGSKGATQITFYDVKYQASNNSQIESLKVKWTMAHPEHLCDNSQNFVDAMAFDVADNIYFVVNGGRNPGADAGYKSKGRLYVFACPKADNSHLTPAASSRTIKVTNTICWHPNYEITNQDLFEMFKRDYKAYHNGQELLYSESNGKIAISHDPVPALNDFMTEEDSPWKWLGDYIKGYGAQRQDVKTSPWATNNELWVDFKKDYKTITGVNPDDQPIEKAAQFLGTTKNTRKVLENAKYKWLDNYIEQLITAQDVSRDKIDSYWPWVLHGFFNQDDKTSSREEGTTTYSHKHGINFSEAGKPEKWIPYYLNSTIHNEAIDIDHEWRVCLNNFFNISKEKTDSDHPFIVDYTTAGKPTEWNDEWLASFPTTPSKVKARGALPYLVRKGYVFAGWYFGNDHESGNPGYDVTAPATIDNIEYGCIYARWIEACLYEGYVTDEQMIAEQRNTYKNFNIDLINALAGKQYDLKIDRKLVGGMYNTMCLPFAIEGKNAFTDIQYVDGSGRPFASVNNFSLVHFVGTTANDDVLVLNFEELGENQTLQANEPFLIKPNTDITKPIQYGSSPVIVPINYALPIADPEDDGEDNDDENQNGSKTEYGLTVGDDDEYFTFTGVLAPVVVSEGSVLLVADNRLAVSSSSGEMMGMRGFFNMKLAVHNMPMAIKITNKDGVSTYIDAVDLNPETQKATKILHNNHIYILRGDEVYTITGNRVR